jgi:outer membrane protein
MHRFLPAFTIALVAGAASAQNMKIGYVDVQRAVQEVEEGKAARSRLQTELQQKRADLEKKRGDLEKMKADYDKQAPVLSDDAKRQRQEQLQKELSGKEQEAMSSISKRLLQVVAEVSDRENFTFVLDKAALLYAPAASDITNEVVRRYNERFGGGQAKAKPAPPAGKAPAPAPTPPKK